MSLYLVYYTVMTCRQD